MERRATKYAVIGVLLMATLVRGGEPWKKKPFTQWTQSEVNTLLADSPWALRIARRGPDTTTVVWYSSLTVREALARQAQLQRGLTAQQASDSLSRAQEHYVVVVYRPSEEMFYGSKPLTSLRLFDAGSEAIIRQSAYLLPLRSKKRIAPAKVEFVRDGDYVMQVVCFFPRAAEGSAVIGPEETDVEFGYEWGRGSSSVIFSLRKMVRDGQPDL